LDIVNMEEEARIRELIAAGTYPNGWDGSEPNGSVLLPEVYGDGSIQPLLWEVGV
jgi:DNA sulfur modification protein DndC